MIAWKLQPFPTGQGYRRYRAKQACHRNASMLAFDRPELRIVRGYMLAPWSMWIGHWWCVDAEDRVIDPTLCNVGLAYIGEELDTKEVAREMAKNGESVLGVHGTAPHTLWVELYRLAGRTEEADQWEEQLAQMFPPA